MVIPSHTYPYTPNHTVTMSVSCYHDSGMIPVWQWDDIGSERRIHRYHTNIMPSWCWDGVDLVIMSH